MSDTTDVIAAFADGELVDPGQLTGALADEAGREHLVDLLALRGLMGGSPGARLAVAATSSPLRARRWLGIAALVAVGVAGGFFAGQRRAPSLPTTVSAGQGSGAPATPMTAPSPTRVIRLENGVDWNERAGGN